jgi:hypothetical protein
VVLTNEGQVQSSYSFLYASSIRSNVGIDSAADSSATDTHFSVETHASRRGETTRTSFSQSDVSASTNEGNRLSAARILDRTTTHYCFLAPGCFCQQTDLCAFLRIMFDYSPLKRMPCSSGNFFAGCPILSAPFAERVG